jgi:hypothetical protein
VALLEAGTDGKAGVKINGSVTDNRLVPVGNAVWKNGNSI